MSGIAKQVALLAVCALWGASSASAENWPMWRFDAERRAVTELELASEMSLQWTRELPEPRRAWPEQYDNMDKLDFDISYSPIAAEGLLFVPSMTRDSVTAYDVVSGEERWRFYADGPVRFAPVYHEGLLLFISDDGHLYCLEAASGDIQWKFLAVPDERRLLGNERLISMWPARGGPVLRDGIVYFAASVWPFMGTFIYAMDARTGEVIWSNTGSGANFELHQHSNAYAFGGVAPQGYLAVSEDTLLVSGGRTVPAAYNRADGEYLFFRQATHIVGKGAGGYAVSIQGDWFYNHGEMYSMSDGAQFQPSDAQVFSDEAIYALEEDDLVVYSPDALVEEIEIQDRLARRAIRERYTMIELWRANLGSNVDRIHLKAGDTLFASGPNGRVAAIRVSGDMAETTWNASVDGEIWQMIAAHDRLFVITEEGAVYCFGADEGDPRRYAYNPVGVESQGEEWAHRAKRILEEIDFSDGYALALGIGSGSLIKELVRQSQLHIVVLDPDIAKVDRFRGELDDAGVYGVRVAILPARLQDAALAPYWASVLVCEDLDSAGLRRGEESAFLEHVFHPLRPYGGSAFLPSTRGEWGSLANSVSAAKLENNSRLTLFDEWAQLTRHGRLPGAGQWTHQYANSANTTFTPEERLKAPLGLLWFGGPNNHNALPRHGNGPVPHVVDGRLFVMGVDTISARDVYTGRELWVRDLPGVGHAYTSLDFEERFNAGEAIYMPNRPGAGFIGSNYISVSDGIYVLHDESLLRLDPVTGRTMQTYDLPDSIRRSEGPSWGFINIWEDLLIVAARPQVFDDRPIGDENWNYTSSEALAVMDRHSGEMLWYTEARYGFRHNAIIAASGKLFLIDSLSPEASSFMARRGLVRTDEPRILAIDAYTGELRWSSNNEVFGTWLSYNEEHDILVEAGRTGHRGAPSDEPRDRMRAWRGSSGEALWLRRDRYTGPIIVHLDRIISSGRNDPTIDLLTGETQYREHPITGEPMPIAYARTYGCGTQNASVYLAGFRSGAAGYADLQNNGGTSNLGGFRSGCTNNLVPADGVLNAPEYTRTCTCAYQNQTSLALIHMPDVEAWTFNQFDRGEGFLERVGLNFGAPGDHLTENGVLWLDKPSVGGPSPDLDVEFAPDDVRWFRRHSSRYAPEGNPLVAASGGEGLERITVRVNPNAPRASRYNVRLFFAEPNSIEPGERVFDVRLNGLTVIEKLDIIAEANGRYRTAVIKDIPSVDIQEELVIELIASDESIRPTLICGVEIIAEERPEISLGSAFTGTR